MMVGPPAAPTARMGWPSRRDDGGANMLERRAFCQGRTALASAPTRPKAFGYGRVWTEKSSIWSIEEDGRCRGTITFEAEGGC